MLIYVIIDGCEHEGSELRGVYSDKVRAKEEFKKIIDKDGYCDYLDLDEWDIDTQEVKEIAAKTRYRSVTWAEGEIEGGYEGDKV